MRVKVRSNVFAGLAESLTVIVKLKFPGDLGTPAKCPVPAVKLKPTGRLELLLIPNI